MTISSPQELELLRRSGQILAGVLRELAELVKPGLMTDALESKALELTRDAGAVPAFLGYDGYPNALCVSLNDEVVHGMSLPAREIRDGDVVSLDYGVNFQGYFTDAALTVGAGSISKDARNLIEDTKKSLQLGLKAVKAGKTIGDVGFAISKFLKAKKYGIVTALVGHGVGKGVHESPAVPNIGYPGKGEELVEGLVIAVEPMVTLGSGEVDFVDHPAGSWFVRSKDGSLVAHFEHTIVVTKGGCEILT